MKTVNLSSLVSSICSGNYCQTDLVQFIHLAQKISLSYLKFQQVLGKRISGERMETDVELEDLAMDCIAELFSRNDKGEFVQLVRYYVPKYEEADLNDADVLVLTRRLVVRKTKQELSRIFRERDPEGAKIVRNIKVAVRNSDKLNLFREMGREYIYYTNGHHIDPMDQEAMNEFLRRDKSSMSEDLLNSRFIEIYQPNDSVSTCIRKLFERIYYYEEYQNFLSLDSIVKLVRNIKFDAFRERLLEDDFVATPVDELESKEIESYISVVMKTVGQKIESQYLRTGKLDQERADIYYQALRDVLHDLIQKKDNSSYYRNLKYYLPELSQQEYRSEERSVFEYLAKVAKREFRKHLKELL
ncbi:hypothetical protein GF406_11225 [candidate division KSB1 bacterium]|nr:hypothetical protein [candidate division KSB1 bacterium]